ncbi:hypothetical protein CFP56_008658 [Quercus suber]|uniref:DC1 domain-containing protein n=1 Tax=Quercus suber TaxID=58331 RepID=A0AAW0M4Y7_QUESU
MELLQHFCHPEHPLVFNQNDRRGHLCWGCQELVFGPSYSCKECEGIRIILKRKKRANAKSVKNLVMNTLIGVTVATSTFTLDVALAYPPWKLNSMTTPIDTHLEVDHVHLRPLWHKRRQRLYYCSKCDFVVHLNCAIDEENGEDINLLELKDGENEDAKLDQSVE